MEKAKTHFYQAFDATVRKFNLDINEIAESSGIPSTRLALFRGGFDAKVDTVETLLAAMPIEAKSYLMELVINPSRAVEAGRCREAILSEDLQRRNSVAYR